MVSFELADKNNAFRRCLAQDGVAQSLLVRNILLFLRPSATLAAMMCYNMRKVIIIPPAP